MISIVNKILKGKINTVFVFTTPYQFLVYLAAFGSDKLQDSLLVTSASDKNIFSDYFGDTLFVSIKSKNVFLKIIRYIIYRIKFAPLKIALFIRKKNISFVGVDHVFLSDILLVSEYTLIEDGLSNYLVGGSKINFLYSFFIKHPFGLNTKCKKVVMTGIRQIPTEIEPKAVYCDILNSKYKDEILRIFNFSSQIIKGPNVLLITQPISEVGLCTEEEKMEIYKSIFDGDEFHSYFHLIVKPHPREETDYDLFFDGVTVLDAQVPIEVYCLAGMSFDKVITLYSTGINNVISKEKVLLGTRGICFLEARVGIINEERW